MTVPYDRHGTGAPALLLIHGGRANGGWWDAVVPLLEQRFTLLVPDLSGHGGSGHRPEYWPASWVQDVAAVIEATGDGPVQAVGHSMGGKVAIWLAALRPELVSGVVLVDCPVFEPGTREPVVHSPWTKRIYPSAALAAQRFQLQPRGPAAVDPELLERVAFRSVGPVDGGWTWKTDAITRGRFGDADLAERLTEMRCPVGAVFALQSQIVGPARIDAIARRVGPLPVVAVDGSGHHVPLEVPQACADAIELLVHTNAERPRRSVQR